MSSYHLETECLSRNLILEITEKRILKLGRIEVTEEILKIIKLLRWWLKTMLVHNPSNSMLMIYQKTEKNNTQQLTIGLSKLAMVCSQNEKLKLKTELHIESCYLLAICYSEGIGIEQNLKKAIELFQTNTLKQHPYVPFHLKNLSDKKTNDERNVQVNIMKYYLQLLQIIPTVRQEAFEVFYHHAVSFMNGIHSDGQTTLDINKTLAFQIFSALKIIGHIKSENFLMQNKKETQEVTTPAAFGSAANQTVAKPVIANHPQHNSTTGSNVNVNPSLNNKENLNPTTALAKFNF